MSIRATRLRCLTLPHVVTCDVVATRIARRRRTGLGASPVANVGRSSTPGLAVKKRPRKRTSEPPASQQENPLQELSPAALREISGSDDKMLGVLLLYGTASAVRSMTGSRDARERAIDDLAKSVLDGIAPKSGVEGLLGGTNGINTCDAGGVRAKGSQRSGSRAARSFCEPQRPALAHVHSSGRRARAAARSNVQADRPRRARPCGVGGQAIVGAVEQRGETRGSK